MIQKFQIAFQKPDKEEYSVLIKIAKENPGFLDGRDIWVLTNFTELDFDE